MTRDGEPGAPLDSRVPRWTEAVARLGLEHVGDRAFRRARAQFSEAELVNLTMAITAIEGWSRLAIAFRAQQRSPATVSSAAPSPISASRPGRSLRSVSPPTRT